MYGTDLGTSKISLVCDSFNCRKCKYFRAEPFLLSSMIRICISKMLIKTCNNSSVMWFCSLPLRELINNWFYVIIHPFMIHSYSFAIQFKYIILTSFILTERFRHEIIFKKWYTKRFLSKRLYHQLHFSVKYPLIFPTNF